MKNTILSFFMLMFLWLTSCDKKEAGPGPSPADLTGNWRKTAESADGQDLWCLYYYDTCALDDSWRFARDGTYEIIDEGMRCGTTPTPPGHWQLDGKTLQLDNVRYEILRCNNELWLQGTRHSNGFSVHHEMRFRRT
jgi:hypothetical protein